MPAAAVISGLVAHFEVVAVKKFVVEGHIVASRGPCVQTALLGASATRPNTYGHYAHW